MTRSSQEIQDWIADWVGRRAGIAAHAVDPHAPVTRYGIDSLGTVRLIADVEQWLGIALRDNPFADYPTIAELADYVAERQCK